ncbi:42406_t:CDS:2 [Gigaspora margarita]|uniref:42406_t:CDS:1 n=1 Tax=Gigaspora margarita TaxID=4874 RepID=A0ABN7UDI5_GIGMA|nr:42406_t:CDS:2 [Gigaspora margarita]
MSAIEENKQYYAVVRLFVVARTIGAVKNSQEPKLYRENIKTATTGKNLDIKQRIYKNSHDTKLYKTSAYSSSKNTSFLLKEILHRLNIIKNGQNANMALITSKVARGISNEEGLSDISLLKNKKLHHRGNIEKKGRKRLVLELEKAIKEDWDQYKDKLKKILKAKYKLKIVLSLDNEWGIIQNSIIKAAQSSMPRKKKILELIEFGSINEMNEYHKLRGHIRTLDTFCHKMRKKNLQLQEKHWCRSYGKENTSQEGTKLNRCTSCSEKQKEQNKGYIVGALDPFENFNFKQYGKEPLANMIRRELTATGVPIKLFDKKICRKCIKEKEVIKELLLVSSKIRGKKNLVIFINRSLINSTNGILQARMGAE